MSKIRFTWTLIMRLPIVLALAVATLLIKPVLAQDVRKDPVLDQEFVEVISDEGSVEPFYLSRQEVSQQLYESVMGANPSSMNPANQQRWGARLIGINEDDAKNFPVETVTVRDALEFCERLNAIARSQQQYVRYRLPTTDEMFVAMGDGSPKDHFVNSHTRPIKSLNDAVLYDRNYKGALHPLSVNCDDVKKQLGLQAPLATTPRFKLHHILGNVAEWCYDPSAPLGQQYRIAGGHIKLNGNDFFNNKQLDKVKAPWDVIMPNFPLNEKAAFSSQDQQVGFRLALDFDRGDRLFRFSAQHRLKVTNLPADAKKVEVWFWLPLDTPIQRVLDLDIIEKPEKTRVVWDRLGNRYLAAEIDNPNGANINLATSFQIERVKRQVTLPIDDSVPELTEDDQQLFEDDLSLSPDTGFQITNSVLDASRSEGIPDGSSPVKAMYSIFDWVVRKTVHYRNANATGVESSGIGSAEYCLENSGGGCTDQHSLVIAWARSRGIPARILFGQRLPNEEGVEGRAGYRCIVEYFVSGFGWVQMDASQAGNSASSFVDTNGEIADEKQWRSQINKYFSGLDDIKRISFYRGRNEPLINYDGQGTTLPLELFIHAYVVVDGKPHKDYQVTLNYTKN